MFGNVAVLRQLRFLQEGLATREKYSLTIERWLFRLGNSER
jgi:hypothetical protein